MSEGRVVTCTYHCSGCGKHFHSLGAFDIHRTGRYADPLGSEEGRRCLSPVEIFDKDGNERLEALTDSGECRVYREVQRDVTVWTVAGAREAMASRFGKGSRDSGEAA